MTFRAVIFDLGGVVLGSPLQAFREYERELGLAPGTLGRAVNAAGAGGAWSRLERGELAMEPFFAAFDAEMAAAGARISAVVLMERVALASGVRPQMVAAVRQLRASGLRTAALTNNWVDDDQQQKMNVLRDEFDVFVESARVGMRKPEPGIYQLTCAQLGVAPEQAVFLDDIGQNLKAARALGMATIKVEDADRALAELEQLLGLSLRASS
jgi:epoxide hydrolase-like predicted phosphatase